MSWPNPYETNLRKGERIMIRGKKSAGSREREFRRASKEPNPCLQVCVIAMFVSVVILVFVWVRLNA